jgi:hypothetical protein
MDWETIISGNTISICPTMTPIEKPCKPWTKTHTDKNQTSPLAMPEWQSEEKGSVGIADET